MGSRPGAPSTRNQCMVPPPPSSSACKRTHRRPPPARHRSGIVLVGALAVLVASCSSGSSGAPSTNGSSTTASPSATSTTVSANGLPGIHHVFVIVLENEGYQTTFGTPLNDPYLASTLPAAGALLTDYYAIGHFSNDNYVALISGQAPNPLNQADCLHYVNFPPTATVAPDGQISDSGCIFPAPVTTVANQLTEAHLTWKGYMQDMGNVPSRESAVCGHATIGTPDQTETAVAGDGYAARHDPFVYFHSIIDDAAYCDAHVVPLGTTTGALPAGTPAGVTGLASDLKSVATTPNFSFITPNLRFDGHDAPCVNQQASPSALTNIDTFLQTWVPMITNSPAFKKNGLLEITFDEADTDNGNPADATACCNEVPGPASALPGFTGPGGGRIGTVLLSPFIKGGTVSSVPYNHYSTLATIEDIFGLAKLGQAKTVSSTFGRDVFTDIK
jgi:phosphatidylinositol-3-phosphatase